MNKPTISVVMVTRNVERFLAEAIESILGQSFQDFEFIIVDFGSTDKSKEIASSYGARDSRIRLHEIAPCVLAEARNTACRLALGKYIAVMDSDDVAVPDRLLWEFEFMEKHPAAGLVGGATQWIDATGRLLDIHDFPTEDSEIRSQFADCCPFCQPTVLMRRDAFELVGGYRRVLPQAEDYDLWMRISDHFQVANLHQVVLKYRIHPYQVSMRKREQQTFCILAAQASASLRSRGASDLLQTSNEITPELLQTLGITEDIRQTALASDCRDWVRNMISAGECAVALRAVVEFLESSSWKHVERWRIADLWLTAARLYWGQQQFLKSLLTVGHALVVRPVVLGRPFKPLLRRIGLA